MKQFILLFCAFLMVQSLSGQSYPLLSWGNNIGGQIGTGPVSSRSDPTPPTMPNGQTNLWRQIEGGGGFTVGIKDDGTLWTWGFNGYGQLGDGTPIANTSRITPTQISAATDWVQISCGDGHVLALKSDGSVYAWGQNNNGQLGDGTTIDRNVPTLIQGLSVVSQVAAGGFHSLALLSDGTVKTWGNNQHGQLGLGFVSLSNVTPMATNLNGVTQIAAGSGYSLAVLNGVVKAWGANSSGQLGDGTTDDRSIPITVNISSVTRIVAGASHTLALLPDGTVKSWGSNGSGELGDGSTMNRSTPTTVVGLSGISQIAAGGSYSLALNSGGTLKTWGINNNGQLGDGTTTSHITPTALESATVGNVHKMSASYNTSYALTTPIPLCNTPTNLAVTTNHTTANITWTAGSTEVEWEIYRATDVSDVPNSATPPSVSAHPTPTYSFPMVQDVTYYVYVRANCSSTYKSDWTPNYVSCTIPCVIPTNVTASVNGTTGTLNWTAGNVETAWDIYFAPDAFSPPNAATTPSVIGHNALTYSFPMTTGVQYRAYVRSRCSAMTQSAWTSDFVSCGIKPANDPCANAVELFFTDAATGIATEGTTIGATADPNIPNCEGQGRFSLNLKEVWYKFNAGSHLSARMALKYIAHEGHLNYAIYKSSCGQVPEYCGTERVPIDYDIDYFTFTGLEQDQTYYIAVSSSEGFQEPTFSIQLIDNEAAVSVADASAGTSGLVYDGCNNANYPVEISPNRMNGNRWVRFMKDDDVAVAINAQGNNLGIVNVLFYINNPANPLRKVGTNKFYLDRNFKIVPQNQPTPGGNKVRVRLYLTNAEIQRLTMALGTSITTLGISKFPDVPMTCIAATFQANNPQATFIPQDANEAVFSNSGKFIEFQTSSFSEIFIGSEDLSVLPLDLLDFKANTEGSKIRLNWTTANEKNVAHFDIERSADGQVFEKIGEQKAVGKTDAYTFIDANPFFQINYYRLKINELDGASHFSKTIVLEKNSDKSIKIRRNTEGSLFIETNDKIESVTVSNSIGQVISTSKESRLSLMDLPKGIYIVSVKTDKAFGSEKVFNF